MSKGRNIQGFLPTNTRALRSVADRFLRKEEAVGSNPTGSIFLLE